MCKCCDYSSNDCKIYKDGVGDWYLDIKLANGMSAKMNSSTIESI